jgi:hypothetical protein
MQTHDSLRKLTQTNDGIIIRGQALAHGTRVMPPPRSVHAIPCAQPEHAALDAWKEASLVLEIDSAEWHRFGGRLEETERRRARYAAAGQRVFPVSLRRIRDDPTAVLGELEAACMSGLAATTAGSLTANTALMRERM